MRINYINIQTSPYLKFTGKQPDTTVMFSEVTPSADAKTVDGSPEKNTGDKVKDAILASLPEVEKPLTDEEIRIANETGKLPERYCVEKRSDRERLFGLDKYVLRRGSVQKNYDERLIRAGSGSYLYEVPAGYKVVRKENGKRCILVKIEN